MSDKFWLNLEVNNGPSPHQEFKQVEAEFCEACGNLILSAKAEAHKRTFHLPMLVREESPVVSHDSTVIGTAIHELVEEFFGSKGTNSCETCRLIERKESEADPHDEDAHYQLERLRRTHRKECPNRKDD